MPHAHRRSPEPHPRRGTRALALPLIGTLLSAALLGGCGKPADEPGAPPVPAAVAEPASGASAPMPAQPSDAASAGQAPYAAPTVPADTLKALESQLKPAKR